MQYLSYYLYRPVYLRIFARVYPLFVKRREKARLSSAGALTVKAVTLTANHGKQIERKSAASAAPF